MTTSYLKNITVLQIMKKKTLHNIYIYIYMYIYIYIWLLVIKNNNHFTDHSTIVNGK